MINDLPTAEDYEEAAKSQFDFGWDIVIQLLTMLDEMGYQSRTLDDDDVRNFWFAARKRVLASVMAAQQGVELAIKGKIIAVSPYLLIKDPVNLWPKSPEAKFSTFKTVDANDLLNLHNSVCAPPFDGEFIKLFEKFRKIRNTAAHSSGTDITVSAHEVIHFILEAHSYLYPNDRWVPTRKEFLDNSPSFVLYGAPDLDAQLVSEFWTVFKILNHTQRKRYFKINSKQRNYICPKCHYQSQEYSYGYYSEPKYAVLAPKSTTSLYCFVCDEEHDVEREACKSEECPSNVISFEYDVCCTCGTSQ